MREIDDPLLRDRMHDLEDLSNRLIRIVSGRLGTAAQMGLREDSILIAKNLGPAELLEYDRRRLKGVVLEEGSLTAHVIIVARAMGVPVLGRAKDIKRLVAEGDKLLLDVGGEARVHPPDPGDGGGVRGQAGAEPEAPRRLRRAEGRSRRSPRTATA